MAVNVVFLDFDGVIRLSDASGGPASFSFRSEKVQLVVDFVRSSRAKIVVSSSWRQMVKLDRMIAEMGGGIQKSDFHEKWMTPILDAKSPFPEKEIARGTEISTWLFNHDPNPNFVIFDDLESNTFSFSPIGS